jgi:hypothetical protein
MAADLLLCSNSAASWPIPAVTVVCTRSRPWLEAANRRVRNLYRTCCGIPVRRRPTFRVLGKIVIPGPDDAIMVFEPVAPGERHRQAKGASRLFRVGEFFSLGRLVSVPPVKNVIFVLGKNRAARRSFVLLTHVSLSTPGLI